jgi:hypothetical protein
MKFLKYIYISAFAVMFISCSSSQKVLSSWVNKEELKGKKYSKIFVMALTQNQTARTIVEFDLASTLKEHGYETVKSIDALAGFFKSNTNPSEADVLAKVREQNCDLIFTVSLLDSKSETRYVPGTTSYYYSPYPSYGFYGGFGGYYGHYAPAVYSPGYYTTDKSYYLEGNLFDVVTEKILWSVQSVTYNPDGIKQFSATYCKLLVSQAQDDDLLK